VCARRVPLNQNRNRWNLATFVPFNIVAASKGTPDGQQRKPNEKQPGEHPEGKYHYNPGNMAGKKPGDAEQTDKTVARRRFNPKKSVPVRPSNKLGALV
jgi:hypothetical protein